MLAPCLLASGPLSPLPNAEFGDSPLSLIPVEALLGLELLVDSCGQVSQRGPVLNRSFIAEKLKLKASEGRCFLLSLSGGADSVALLHLMTQLREFYPLRLYAFHLNFGLRAKESVRDERFCRKTCKKLKVPLFVAHSRVKPESFSQDRGRRERLFWLEKVLPQAELLEAQHADDLVEGFLFRLFRGGGPFSWASMQPESLRDSRRLRRPLISVWKSEILEFLEAQSIDFVNDSSNESLLYDRNWIRQKLLPKVEKRFPKAKTGMLRALQILSDETQDRAIEYEAWKLQNSRDSGLLWAALQKLTRSRRVEYLQKLLRERYQMSLDFASWQAFHAWMESGGRGGFNAARALVLRRVKMEGSDDSVLVFDEKGLLELSSAHRKWMTSREGSDKTNSVSRAELG